MPYTRCAYKACVTDGKVYIVMPPLAEVRAVTDQLRFLSSQVCLAANHEGSLKLEVIDSEVVGEASWSHLEHPRVQHTEITTVDTPQSMYRAVHMSMRALQNVLGAAGWAQSTIACICSGYCLVFYVYLSSKRMSDNRSNTHNPPVEGGLNVR